MLILNEISMEPLNTTNQAKQVNGSIDQGQAAMANSQQKNREALLGADISPALERTNLANSIYSLGNNRVSLEQLKEEIIAQKELRKLQNKLTGTGNNLDIAA